MTRKRSPRVLLLITLFFGLIVVFVPVGSAGDAKPGKEKITLTILHSNDFHGADMELLARRATIIKKVRAECRIEEDHPVLLLDAGDIFGRGPYAAKLRGALEFACMNEMGYDAVTLGNHEFKAANDLVTARKILMERIRQARFPVLCANVVEETTQTVLPGVKSYVVKEVEGMKIAIYGLTTPKVKYYHQFKGLKFLDPVLIGETLAWELSKQVDLVIALTHIGFFLDWSLAERTSGLVAVVGGDSHSTLQEPIFVNEQPIVQAGDSGRYLGRLDLTLRFSRGKWKVEKVTGKLLDLSGPDIVPDREIQLIINQMVKTAKDAA